MPEPITQYAAFISHASKNFERAMELVSLLESRGLDCWIAPRNIRPSKAYSSEISHGIETSRCLVLLLSDDANRSEAVRNEIELAFRKKKPIFPVRIEDVQPGTDIEFFVSSVQWIDAWRGRLSEHIETISDSIRHGSIVTPSRPAKKHLPVKKAAYTVGAVIAIGLAVFLVNEVSTLRDDIQQAGTVAPATVPTIDLDKITSADFRPAPFLFGESDSTLYLSTQFSPRLGNSGLLSNSVDFYMSLDGNNYEKMPGIGNIEIKLTEANIPLIEKGELYLRFETWEGKTIGPFKYQFDFFDYLYGQMKQNILKGKIISCFRPSQGKTQCSLDWRVEPNLAVVNRLEYDNDPAFPNNTALDFSTQHRLKSFVREWVKGNEVVPRYIYINVANNDNQVYTRLVYRDGTRSETRTIKIRN